MSPQLPTARQAPRRTHLIGSWSSLSSLLCAILMPLFFARGHPERLEERQGFSEAPAGFPHRGLCVEAGGGSRSSRGQQPGVLCTPRVQGRPGVPTRPQPWVSIPRAGGSVLLFYLLLAGSLARWKLENFPHSRLSAGDPGQMAPC